jgi:hypothetical protein
MAWFGLDKLLLGYDLNAEQQRSATLDAQIQDANRRLESQGAVPAGYSDLAAQDIAQGNQSTGTDNVVASVNAEAAAGAAEGLNNVLTAPGRAVGLAGQGATTLLWSLLKNIPWWLYLAAGAALFVWMGGLSLLRGRLSKR